jgi:hypothetical protein
VFDPSAPTADYALTWPRELFRTEAADLVRGAELASRTWTAEAAWLLEDAFAGEIPAADLRATTSTRIFTARQTRQTPATVPDSKTAGYRPGKAALAALATSVAAAGTLIGDPQHQYLQYLIDHADQLPLHDEPAYWSARQGADAADPRLPLLQVHWAALVAELRRKGYLARVAPPVCVRAPLPEPPPDYLLNQETARRLDLDDVWPLAPGRWEQDTFWSLVELVHDLVARPRRRIVHNHRDHDSWCGWHFAQYSLQTGQAVYRWQVDRLLVRHRVGLRFAATGEDVGRLVRVTGDDRDDLVQRALATPDPGDRAAVRHAVALFRARDATRDDKRSAVAALARILEDHRGLLKTELLSKDESALFEIANRFDIRHRRADQHPDYDEAYLDWIFWWYLATAELTDRLLARQP